jgi:hypothetical protein
LDYGVCQLKNFFFIINDIPSGFFRSSRGLRKGFPLSPLLFLIIVEGFSRIIMKPVEKGKIEGILIANGVRITHFFLWMILSYLEKYHWTEWKFLKDALDLFFNVIGMTFDSHKSHFLEAGWSREELSQLKEILPYEVKYLDDGFKYLGFFLKPKLLLYK